MTDLKRLDGRIAFITGGGRSIGRAIAQAYAAAVAFGFLFRTELLSAHDAFMAIAVAVLTASVLVFAVRFVRPGRPRGGGARYG